MDLTLYEKILRSDNKNIALAYINDTVDIVNYDFDKSPSFRRVDINNESVDCIISHTNKSNILDLLFRPKSVFNKGEYVVIDNDTYMITEFIPNEIYPKAKIELCNSILKWKNSNGEIKEYKCIIKNSSYSTEGNNRQVYNSGFELEVLVQYNDDTKTIKPIQRFIFGETSYEVEYIDLVSNVYNGNGIITLGVKFANIASTDDKVNQIADDTGNSGWGKW